MTYPPYNQDYGYAPLSPASDVLTGLSPEHRSGLTAVAFFGTLSFISASCLFLFLTFKFVRWRLQNSIALGRLRDESHAAEGNNHANTISLALNTKDYAPARSARAPNVHMPASPAPPQYQKKAPNQFLILFYNLLLADMHQAVAFMLNITWLTQDEISVGTRACWTQGLFVSNGDLSASCFISAIAFHTYFSIVKGYRPPHWVLYTVIAGLWAWVYLLAIVGIIITNNGKEVGGLYVRAVAWCWMNIQYEKYRLWLHYFWIFGSLALTSVLYTLIFLFLRSKKTAGGEEGAKAAAAAVVASGHHPAFLVYPIIYVLCTAPLALGRVATMAGAHFSIQYFCFAGAMISSNGWLDVLLWSITRRSIIFTADVTAEEDGVETFAFMRTPYGRQYGNMVWVQGGIRDDADRSGHSKGGFGQRKKGSRGWEVLGERMGWRERNNAGRSSRCNSGLGNWSAGQGEQSQESLRNAAADMRDADNNGIMLDTVTTVVIENDRVMQKRQDTSFSDGSSDKDELPRIPQ